MSPRFLTNGQNRNPRVRAGVLGMGFGSVCIFSCGDGGTVVRCMCPKIGQTAFWGAFWTKMLKMPKNLCGAQRRKFPLAGMCVQTHPLVQEGRTSTPYSLIQRLCASSKSSESLTLCTTSIGHLLKGESFRYFRSKEVF